MTVTRSVVPGDWYGVLGDSVLVLLPPEAKSRVATVWERVDDGAGFDEVLDALISGGLRELPGFVLVSAEGAGAQDVKVVIRGPGEAELTTAGGSETVAGSADSTWVERHATGVTRLRVRVGDDAGDGDGTPYLLGTGLVRVAVVEQPPRSAQQPSPTDRRAPEPAPVPEPPAPPVPPVPPVPPAVPIPVPPPLGGPAFEPQQPPPVVEPQPEAYASGPPEPAPEDGDTQAGGFTPAHLADREEAPPPPSRPVARLLFSSGEVVEVDRTIVIGRAPEARRPGDDRARLVTVPSPQQEISSTHLEIRPGSGADHGSAVATDLGSTNGTVVVQPGLPAEDLQPGIAVALVPGAIVDLGEGVTIQVTGV